MPITRTPIYDDSGQGTDGTIIDNAWKQELYNQIDALAAAGLQAMFGTWTPTDASGAGLALTLYGRQYAKVGRIVVIQAHIGYPGNSNGAAAKIGGLPHTSTDIVGGLYSTQSGAHTIQIPGSGTQIAILNSTSGGGRTNAELSGQSVHFAGVYLASA